MPKPFHVRLEAPSNSRTTKLFEWLNRLLEPHNMRATCLRTEDGNEQIATPGTPLLPALLPPSLEQAVMPEIRKPEETAENPQYKEAWTFMHDELNWMQGHPELNEFLGLNFATVANRLIDRAYPGLRDRAKKQGEKT